MGFVHRKLMGEPPLAPAPAPAPVVPLVNATAAVLSPDSVNATLNAVCSPFCNPLINSSGYCLGLCLPLCPANCRLPIPPPDDDSFSDYSPPPPIDAGKHHLSPLLVTTFVALSLAVLIVIGYIVCVKRWGRRRNRGGRRNRAQLQRAVPPQDDEFLDDLGPVLDHPIWYIHTVGLQPSVISKIAVCKYNKGEGLIDGTECSVCLTEFEEDETLRLLPKCSHAFHVPCIDTWLRSHTNCPNCRAPIVNTAARSPSPEQSGSWENIRLDEGSNDVELGRETIEDVPHLSGRESEESTELAGDDRPQGVVDESGNGIQPIRRSVSVDSLSAAKINALVAELLIGKSMRNSDPELGDLENQLDHKNKRVADSSSSSIERSSQFLSEPSTSMKRSLSCSGRLFVSKYSRSRGSVFPQ